MATLPPGPQPLSAAESHRARQIAESFGSDAPRYDRARPRYPQALADRILAASPGRDVLDVGIGTGISALPFDAAGCRVLGVEVDPRMAEVATRRGFEVEVAKFEDWDPRGRTFDVVVAGQAWHWIDPVAGAAKAAQVLRGDGRLAVFWNVFEFPPDLRDEVAAAYRRVVPESPFGPGGLSGGASAYSALLAKSVDGMDATGAFGKPERWRLDWEHPYTRDELLDLIPTAGGHNQFPPAKLEALLEAIGDAVDRVGGTFSMRYATLAVTAARDPR